MDDAQISREIDELERALLRDQIDDLEHQLADDDPAFRKRMNSLHRSEIVNTLTVSLLLFAGAVLLTTGIATLSWPIWGGGGVAFLASFAIDHHYRQRLRRRMPT